MQLRAIYDRILEFQGIQSRSVREREGVSFRVVQDLGFPALWYCLTSDSTKNRLYNAASTEAEARMEDADRVRRRGQAGHYGITAEEEEGMRRRKKVFTRNTLSPIKSQLKIVSQSYQVRYTSSTPFQLCEL